MLAARAEGVRYIADHVDEAAALTAKAYRGDARHVCEGVPHAAGRRSTGPGGKLEYPIMDRMVEGCASSAS